MKKRIALIVGALVLTFAAGVAVGMRSASIATTVNAGLVNALDSVGQNLFGSDAFKAALVALLGEPDPTGEVEEELGVQMDIVAHPPDPNMPEVVGFPKVVNIAVAHPPDPNFPPSPCRVGLQMTVNPSNPDGVLVRAIYDSRLVTDGVLTVEAGRLDNTGAFCESLPVDDGLVP